MPIPVPSATEPNVAAAEGVVRTFCKWNISPVVTEAVTVDGSGTAVQMLPTLYLTGVTGVTSDGVAVADTDYDWSTNGYLELQTCDVWSRRLRGVSATITHGYDVMPAEVQAVIDRVAQRILDDPGMVAQVGQVRYATAPGSIAPAGVLTEDDRRVLLPYRIPGTP